MIFILENQIKVVHSKGNIPLKRNTWYMFVKIYKPSWYIHTYTSNNDLFWITQVNFKVENIYNTTDWMKRLLKF